MRNDIGQWGETDAAHRRQTRTGSARVPHAPKTTIRGLPAEATEALPT